MKTKRRLHSDNVTVVTQYTARYYSMGKSEVWNNRLCVHKQPYPPPPSPLPALPPPPVASVAEKLHMCARVDE